MLQVALTKKSLNSKEWGEEDQPCEEDGEGGADDFDTTEEGYIVVTPPDKLMRVKEKLEADGVSVLEASLEMLPKNSVACDEATAKANQELINWLEDLDDVDAVFHNMEE